MKGSGIGGQAVMEGVMMKNGEKYAVAVRKPDNEIIVDVQEHKSFGSKYGLDRIPILRGVVAFIDSLVLGVGTLTYSSSFFEEDEEDKKPLDAEGQKKKDRQDKAIMAGTVCLSIVLAVGIFMLLPYFLSQLLKNLISSAALLAFLEGVIRVALFVGYVAAISLMKDIKRVFMYHGAEHKSINCIEHGLELTVENVRTQSRHHKRCGTSFLLIVMLISVIFFMFIRVDNAWLRVIVRIILIPVIAGISYEFIKLAGRSDNKFVDILSKPGMALQNLTTREPDDSMIECAIASVEAVFDWREFLAHYDDKPEEKSEEKPEEKPAKKNGQESIIDENLAEEEEEQEEIVAKKPEVKEQKKEEISEKKPAEKAKKQEDVTAKKPAEKKKIDIKTPTPIDDDEDDEILKALDQYFVLKQKKDNQ